MRVAGGFCGSASTRIMMIPPRFTGIWVLVIVGTEFGMFTTSRGGESIFVICGRTGRLENTSRLAPCVAGMTPILRISTGADRTRVRGARPWPMSTVICAPAHTSAVTSQMLNTALERSVSLGNATPGGISLPRYHPEFQPGSDRGAAQAPALEQG